MKKAFIFSLDAFFAIILFALVISLVYIFFIYFPGLNQQYFFSDDLLTTLSEVKISELNLNNYPRIKQLVIDGKLQNLDVTLVEQIVTFQQKGDQTSAAMIVEDVITKINKNLKTAIYIGDIKLYGDDPSEIANIISRSRLAVGKK